MSLLSLLVAASGHVMIDAVKRAEDPEVVVVRLLKMGKRIEAAETSLLLYPFMNLPDQNTGVGQTLSDIVKRTFVSPIHVPAVHIIGQNIFFADGLDTFHHFTCPTAGRGSPGTYRWRWQAGSSH